METALSTGDIGLKGLSRPRRRGASSALPEWATGRQTTAFVRARFAIGAALLDACAVTASALAVGVTYHTYYYHVGGMSDVFAGLGLSMAALLIVFNIIREDYSLANYLAFGGHMRRVFLVWNTTFLTTLVLFFATKESAEFSRVSMALFYLVGLIGLVVTRAVIVARVKAGTRSGAVAALRVVLVGEEAELLDFVERYQPWTVGIDIVASAVLRGARTLKEDLALAAASARVLRPDDIFIMLPWSRMETIDACVEAFTQVPASIHLGPQRVLDRFTKARISRIGAIASLHLVRRPLTMPEIIVKRVYDVVLAMLLLIGLMPVFCLVALAIKLDSSGPVFFLQRRHGFNQETFRIVKFRSMMVAEDGSAVRSATRDDPRVTRIGRILRRFNIDELPQLLNVLRGEMSLVGPRPHALVHNQHYERGIADYARRHNVKPGITGWAQIHGLRGEITSEAKMRLRLKHDLYYIDNWSLGLDLRILAMTILSPKTYENAF